MQKPTDRSELLRKASVFASLDDQSLALLAERMKRISPAPGEFICREGDAGDRIFLIADGEVEVLKNAEGRLGVVVATLTAGEIAGEMSLFGEGARSASLRAKGPVEVWELDTETFRQVLARSPEMSQTLLAKLSSRLRRETQLVAQLLSGRLDDRLKIAFFDSKPYTEASFKAGNTHDIALSFFEPQLDLETASLADGFQVICAFVNDRLDQAVLERLNELGVKMIALRCAGYNNVDLGAAHRLGITVARVPAYSPHAVAEHAVALILTLNRKTHRAYNRVHEGNFSLHGLVGFNLNGRTAGVIGVGKIGKCLVEILVGFGMKVLGHDQFQDDAFARRTGLEYVSLDALFAASDVISLHAPLLPETHHMINAKAIAKMKTGVMLINTSRGALLDTAALIEALKSRHIGAAGLDVYEEEEAYFFQDRSSDIITDDLLARLMTFNNVLITSHQGFLTEEALDNIAETTLRNVREFQEGKRLGELTNAVLPQSAR